MATFWEIAAPSANHVLFVSCLFVVLVISNFSFENRVLVLVVPVPGHCLHFTLTI